MALTALDGRVAITQDDDGRQQLTVDRGGARSFVEVPADFPVADLRAEDDGRVRLIARTGRTVLATPGQLALHTPLLPVEADPEHEAHLLAAFTDRGQLPAPDLDAGTLAELFAPITDRLLGTLSPDPATGAVRVRARTSGGPLEVDLSGLSRQRVVDLLPHVRILIAGLGSLSAVAVQYLWEWGVEPDAPHTPPQEWLDELRPEALTVYQCGGFALDLDSGNDLIDELFDGYWPRLHHRRDGTPVAVTVEG